MKHDCRTLGSPTKLSRITLQAQFMITSGLQLTHLGHVLDDVQAQAFNAPGIIIQFPAVSRT